MTGKKWGTFQEWREANAARLQEMAAADRQPQKSGPICPYCDGPSVLVDAKAIYPQHADRGWGRFYLCSPCQAWVGCHPGTTTALGTLANFELRLARNAAHRAFDPIWKGEILRHRMPKAVARSSAYRWLAGELGIEESACHIAMMDMAQCRRVIEICGAVRGASRQQRRLSA